MCAVECPAFRGQQRGVLVAVAYPPMRLMITEFLERDHECWSAIPTTLAELADAIAHKHPDVVVADATDFPRCCQPEFGSFPAHRFVVIGYEPDRAYRSAALAAGAGAWVAADAVGEELTTQMHAALGCPNCAPTRCRS